MSIGELLDRLERERPELLRLAEAVSLAVRVDPPLLRRARREFVPEADAGTEADLWRSPLVKDRGPEGFVFLPEAAEALRSRLAKTDDGRRLGAAWDMTQALHKYLSPALLLEEKIAYLSVSADPGASGQIEAELQSALAAMVAGRALAPWAARAVAALPSAVRSLDSARMLKAGAHLRLGQSTLPLTEEETASDWHWLVPADLPRVAVAVRLFDGAVELDARPDPQGQKLQLPETDPLLVELSWDEPEGSKARQVTFKRGELQRVPVSVPDIRLRTILGEAYNLRKAGTAPRDLRDFDPLYRKARVFISNSSKETKAREIQAALYGELMESPSLVPLIDQSDLEPGDMWRSRINLWVGGCDAAVILLTTEALASDWVFYEVALLSYRCERSPGFIVVPVYVEVGADAVQARYLQTTKITEIQGVQSAGRPLQDVVTDIVKTMQQATYQGISAVEHSAERLASLLQHFAERILWEAAALFQVDLKPWIQTGDIRLLLAAQLQCVGMRAAVPVLRLLRSESANEKGFRNIIDIVASSWVDYRSIDRIKQIAKAQEVPCAIGINAADPETARMYVLRASLEEPARWYFVACHSVVVTLSELITEVGQDIATTLLCEPKEVAEELKVLSEASLPFFVCLYSVGVSTEILAALRQAFPSVVFIILMRDNSAKNTKLIKGLEILFPQLSPGDEERILRDYRLFSRSIRRNQPD